MNKSQKKYYEKNKDKILRKRRERYWANVEEERKLAYKRLRPKESAEKSKDYYHRHNKEIMKRSKARYDPLKNSARGKLQYQIKIGKIKRPETCPVCKKECKVHAHHHDYNKPLEVEWLCSICHGKTHRFLEC